MSKQVAILAVNPVNGSGLFQYLETFLKKTFPIGYLRFQTAQPLKRTPELSCKQKML